MTVLVVDNLSPFMPEILDCLVRLKADHVCKKFSEVSAGDLDGHEKIILSGRRKNSKEVNVANARIVRRCYETGTPLLGICYGAEIIALALGGSIRRMPAQVQGMAKVDVIEPNLLLQNGRGSVSVYESHRYCIARLPNDFRSLASSQHCQHELLSHASKKIYGTQFHPEKSGSDGLTLLKNFVRL